FGTVATVKTETYTGWKLNPTLTVSTTGNGGGTINSIYPASGLITCSNPQQPNDICATTISSERDVKLIASPDATSLFTGWSLGSCPGTGPCMITVSLDAAITGTFTKMPPIKVVSTGYQPTYHTTFPDAFNTARENSIIQLQEALFESSLLFNLPFPVSILGGFDAGFTMQNGFSTLPGLTISSGSSTIDRLIVK
ncbi:MAG: hypothetical protein HXX11_19080, partial [Desulfuromonadales bacterium]|nr:hypothetical protein [Desulfuromonadales bacterium]